MTKDGTKQSMTGYSSTVLIWSVAKTNVILVFSIVLVLMPTFYISCCTFHLRLSGKPLITTWRIEKHRKVTCQTWVSTGMAWCWSREKRAMQAATFGPTPGRVQSASITASSSKPRREASHSAPPPGFACRALTAPTMYFALLACYVNLT